VDVGAYQPGSNRMLDTALERMPMIEAFLRQDVDDPTTLEETVQVLGLIVDNDGAAAA
jgi:flagellum-specific ATP synthase